MNKRNITFSGVGISYAKCWLSHYNGLMVISVVTAPHIFIDTPDNIINVMTSFIPLNYIVIVKVFHHNRMIIQL